MEGLITVTVTGQAGVGKTTVACIIRDALARKGVLVSLVDEEYRVLTMLDDERRDDQTRTLVERDRRVRVVDSRRSERM